MSDIVGVLGTPNNQWDINNNRVLGALQSKNAAQGQPVSKSNSVSGQYLPFPEQSGQIASAYADNLSGILGNFGNGQGGGGASDFAEYFKNVGGPPQNFTDIDVRGVYTPQQQHEGIQAAFANATATGEGLNQQLERTFGMGMGSDSGFLQELLQGNKGRYAAIGADQARKWDQNAAGMNAQQRLASAGAQTNVESLRAGSDQNRRSLGLQARGQDLDYSRSILASMLSGSGLFGPLNYSESSSSSEPLVFSRSENMFG